MKNLFIVVTAMLLLHTGDAFADIDYTYANVSTEFTMIAKSLGDHTLKCGTSGKTLNSDIAAPVFSLSMAILPKNSVRVIMKSLVQDTWHEVGFGGERVVVSESHYNKDWLILSVGDDGRATYTIQNPNQYNYAMAKCTKDGSTRVNFIASKTIGMDGMVDSTAMNCCLE